MKTVSLFLASSITDLHIERMEIGNFIRVLNDRLFDCGADVYFRLGMCEFIDDTVAEERKQNIYNKEIQYSDLCVFLFKSKAGEYTLEELTAARTALGEKGKPEVMIFFMEADDPNASIGALKNSLDAESVPYLSCRNVDFVLFHILEKLAENPENGLRVENTGAAVLLNGKPLREIDLTKLN